MAFDPSNPNLAVWLREEPTDPAKTKQFTRGGGFRGTAIAPTYVMKRLTAAFGPVGWGWGYKIKSSREIIGGPIASATGEIIGHEITQVTEIVFFYYPFGRTNLDHMDEPSGRAEFDQVGQTTYVSYSRKNAYFMTDEEAWKKSLTDAITKAASHIGIGADIHLGLFDDSKYLAERQKDEAADQKALDADAARAAKAAIAGVVFDVLEQITVAPNAAALDEAGTVVRAHWADFTADQRTEITNTVAAARKRLGIPDTPKKAT